jgi:putative RNA 2'-phosphotransferase
MDARQLVKTSKFLSLVLRHSPETIGIKLDAAGWVSVDELLAAAAAYGSPIDLDDLEEVVETNDKKRFSFSADGMLIRANQGHSVSVDLGYQPSVPPEVLYHGTTGRFLESIKREGLVKGKRHHVHLSQDIVTASKVGARRGKPVVLKIDAALMHSNGIEFFVSENSVWLTDHVPPEYLSELADLS